MSQRPRRIRRRFWFFLATFISGLAIVSLVRTAHSPAPPEVPHHQTRVSRKPVHLHWSSWQTSHVVLPHRTMGFSVASSGRTAWILGGLVNQTSSHQIDTLHWNATGHIATPVPLKVTLPTPMHDMAAVSLGNDLLVLGGGTYASSASVYRLPLPHLTPATTLEPLPGPLSDLATVRDGTDILVIGGHDTGAPSNIIWRYRVSQPARIFAHLPAGVRYAAVASGTHHLYVVGGLLANGTYTNNADVYNLRTGTMTRLPPYPLHVQYAEATLVGGRLLVAGGQTASGWTNQAFWFNRRTNTWNPAPALPAPRGYGALLAISGHRALWLGGEGPQGAADNVWTLRLKS